MVLKALVCISNYGTKNETFIDRVISECQGFSFETDIHIDTTQAFRNHSINEIPVGVAAIF